MAKVCGVYNIENIVNGHIYIGSSVNVECRICRHSNDLDKGCHVNIHLQRAFDKYGFENFVWNILVICDPDMLLFYEQRFIDTLHPEYNICKMAGKPNLTDEIRHARSIRMKGNKNLLGYKFSSISKYKMSESAKARTDIRITSIETRQKISAFMKGKKYTLGYKYSSESRRKMSESAKGRKHSDESRKKMSDSRRGRKASEEHKRNISKGLTGRKLSEAHKEYLSNLMHTTQSKLTPEQRSKNAKKASDARWEKRRSMK
jgi:group I intron endonuclease